MSTTQAASADQNQNIANTIDDASVDASKYYIAQFFADGVNVFNKAVPELGGAANELAIVDGTSIAYNISAAEALLLNGTENTYKLYEVDPADYNSKTLYYDGTIDVTALAGSASSNIINFRNSNRITNVYLNSWDLDENDDIIITYPELPITLNLPDPGTMVGKRYEIVAIDVSDVTIKNHDGSNLLTLNGTGHSVKLRAVETIWVPFFQV